MVTYAVSLFNSNKDHYYSNAESNVPIIFELKFEADFTMPSGFTIEDYVSVSYQNALITTTLSFEII